MNPELASDEDLALTELPPALKALDVEAAMLDLGEELNLLIAQLEGSAFRRRPLSDQLELVGDVIGL